MFSKLEYIMMIVFAVRIRILCYYEILAENEALSVAHSLDPLKKAHGPFILQSKAHSLITR